MNASDLPFVLGALALLGLPSPLGFELPALVVGLDGRAKEILQTKLRRRHFSVRNNAIVHWLCLAKVNRPFR